MIDLSTLDTRAQANLGTALDLVHPVTGEKLAGRLFIHGHDSDAYREAQISIQRDRLARMARQRGTPPDPEEVNAEALQLLAACVRGWEDLAQNGQPLPYTGTASALALLQAFPWIREQVDAAVHRRENFLPGSAPT
jgi:hypothetical protein